MKKIILKYLFFGLFLFFSTTSFAQGNGGCPPFPYSTNQLREYITHLEEVRAILNADIANKQLATDAQDIYMKDLGKRLAKIEDGISNYLNTPELMVNVNGKWAGENSPATAFYNCVDFINSTPLGHLSVDVNYDVARRGNLAPIYDYPGWVTDINGIIAKLDKIINCKHLICDIYNNTKTAEDAARAEKEQQEREKKAQEQRDKIAAEKKAKDEKDKKDAEDRLAAYNKSIADQQKQNEQNRIANQKAQDDAKRREAERQQAIIDRADNDTRVINQSALNTNNAIQQTGNTILDAIDRNYQNNQNERHIKQYKEDMKDITAESKTMPCNHCLGTGKKNCDDCRGSGNARCEECSGTGKGTCLTCNGSGRITWGSSSMSCSNCFGSGKTICMYCLLGKVDCRNCRGTGKIECEYCSGSGEVDNPNYKPGAANISSNSQINTYNNTDQTINSSNNNENTIIKNYDTIKHVSVDRNKGFLQDILVKNNTDLIKCILIEVGETSIKYKRFEMQNGPIFTISKSELSKIIYSNGTIETISQNNNNTTNNQTPNIIRKKDDYSNNSDNNAKNQEQVNEKLHIENRNIISNISGNLGYKALKNKFSNDYELKKIVKQIDAGQSMLFVGQVYIAGGMVYEFVNGNYFTNWGPVEYCLYGGGALLCIIGKIIRNSGNKNLVNTFNSRHGTAIELKPTINGICMVFKF